jgi:hypothetical protein
VGEFQIGNSLCITLWATSSGQRALAGSLGAEPPLKKIGSGKHFSNQVDGESWLPPLACPRAACTLLKIGDKPSAHALRVAMHRLHQGRHGFWRGVLVDAVPQVENMAAPLAIRALRAAKAVEQLAGFGSHGLG